MIKKQRTEGSGGGKGKQPGPQYWRRNHPDTSGRKQQQRQGKKGEAEEEDGPNSDNEDNEEISAEQRCEERKKGSYDYEALKLTKEYADRVELDGPKRKYAVCFSYLGSNYQGLQINPGCRSVEAELERALFLAGGISDCNFGNLQKLQWTRAARTDKGVHAIGQCCAMKVTLPSIPSDSSIDGKRVLIEKTNSFLPPDIRVMALSKVTKNFNAKIACSKRRYHYLLPTYMFMTGTTVTNALSEAKREQGDKCRDVARAGGFAEPGSTQYLAPDRLANIRSNLLTSYRVDNATLEVFRSALNVYCGTQSFHNYTTGKKFEDANARRFIMSFTCEDPFVNEANGVEWVLVSVVGQSFLLNQIRKMIGTACEVARQSLTLEQARQTLEEGSVEVPMAPGVGLYLDELFFEQYNWKQQNEMEYLETRNQIRVNKSNGNPGRMSQQDIRATALAAVAAAMQVVATPADNTTSSTEDAPEATAVALSEIPDAGNKRKADEMSNNVQSEAVEADNSGDQAAIIEANAETGATESAFIVDLTTLGEPIRWSSDPLTAESMAAFRTGVVWPHIYDEEAVGLHFLYYLDHLRVKRFRYPQPKQAAVGADGTPAPTRTKITLSIGAK